MTKSFRKSAMICGVSKSTIHRWWTSFYLLSIRNKMQRRKKRKRTRKAKYEGLRELLTTMFSLSDTLKFLSLKEVAFALRSSYKNKPPSLSWIRHVMKSCKISRRRFQTTKVCPRSEQQLQDMYIHFRDVLHNISNEQIVCIDEVAFCNIGNASYGYFVKGKTPKQRNVTRREKVSLVMAIGSDKVICFKQQASAFNKCTFVHFLLQDLIPKLSSSVQYILMDNVRFHHSKEVMKLLNDNNLTPLFIPPYSPRCNPIEEVFSLLKRDFRSLYLRSQSFKGSMKTSLDNLNLLKDNTPYYNHTRTFLAMTCPTLG